jgi:hypothetical protein
MRKYLVSGSRFVWVSVLLLVALLALGVTILPEVLKHDYAAPGMPAGVYIMSLINLALFVGVVISLAFERFERLMVFMFVAFRIGSIAWSYQLGRHSLWYLAGSIIAHLVVGGLVLIFLSGHLRLPPKEKEDYF